MVAPTGREAIPPRPPVSLVKSGVERVEKGVAKRNTSLLANQRDYIFDLLPRPVLEFAYSQPPALLPLAGPHTPPGTPSPPIVPNLDPLALFSNPGIPSPRTALTIERGARISNEFRPASNEWEDAGLLPGVNPIGSAPEFNS